jgi:LysR family glycine cleavage system transcriptional activator
MSLVCCSIGAVLTRLPSLNGLRAFEAVARRGSCARAAKELRVTKAALSHQIRRLEEQLGIPLFTRHARGLVLSQQGKQYLPEVRAAFASLHAATDELLRTRSRRALMVSVTPTLASKWLLPRLAAFYAIHPEIEVRIQTEMRFVNFASQAVDAAIRYGTGAWPGLRSDRLEMTDVVFPVCSPALLNGPLPLRAPADLAAHTLLYVDYQRPEWELWLEAANIAPKVAGDLLRRGRPFDIAYMALQATIEGLGVALGYAPYVEADIVAGRLVRPFDLSLPATAGFDAYFVSPDAAAQVPEISTFRDWLLADAQARDQASSWARSVQP